MCYSNNFSCDLFLKVQIHRQWHVKVNEFFWLYFVINKINMRFYLKINLIMRSKYIF